MSHDVRPIASAVASGRLQCIDLLRALASQLLVWHHLAFYGPLADQAYSLAPVLLGWLGDPARMVVQVFLVIGGFGAAQHLARLRGASWRHFWTEIVRRYCRIGIPYLAMLPVAVCANALAGRWMEHHSIAAAPSLAQLVSHALFLQDILRYEPLSAGIWYLAIDFQLFLLSLAVAMLSMRVVSWRGGGEADDALVWTQRILAVLATSSLFFFNRHPVFDIWGMYYLGSYFLGMLVQWTISGRLPGRMLWAYLGLVTVAVASDWRPRLVVAAATAGLILLAATWNRLRHLPDSRMVAYLGRISFSLFLIHFPVCLVVNAWLSRWELTPMQAFAGMVAAWASSVLMAMLFHHLVERPGGQGRSGGGPDRGMMPTA
jgi:peptidoglycan/LPS O-acetylase OafA/YrhL